MTNRLRLPWQLQLFLIACLFPWTTSLNAQCECGMPINNGTTQVCSGDLFTLTYSGPDTIYVGSDCNGILSTGGSSSVAFMPAPSTTVQSISGGYSEGSTVPAGTVVTYQYIVSDGMTADTLCFEIEFVDTIAPILNTVISDITVDCEMANFTQWWEAQVALLDAVSTDNCNVASVYHSQADTLMDNCGVFVDTFFVEDDFGNVTFTVASYSITDNVGPVFTSFPADQTIDCDDPIPSLPTVVATDNCAAFVTPVFLSETTTPVGVGACASHKYEIHRTWFVTDGCGNVTDSTQVITVDDVTPPTFDMPADTVVACGTPTDVTATGDISNVMDNCTASPTVTVNQTTVGGACPQEMVITRTWQVTDACGNSLAKSQKITVVDTVAPVAVFPADITVACFDSTDDSVTGVPTGVSDNCHPNPTTQKLSDVITAGPCEFTFTVERTWTVTDACGNETMDVQIITVKDTIAPEVDNAAVNLTVTCDVDIAAAFSNWINSHGAADASDNCMHPDSLEWNAYVSGTTNVAALPGPDCVNPTSDIFTTVSIDFIVNDKCGNRDTTTAVFTVADNDPPVIINCPADMTVDTDFGQCESIQTLLLPVVMENCGNTTLPVNLSISQTPTIPSGSDPVETPINDLVYNFNVNGPPYSTMGAATLTIILEEVDAEAPTEYLKVYGENGALLGNVANTALQCGDTLSTFSIPASTVDAWAYDGVLTITVRPNVPASLPGRFSVNPICPNNLVTAELSYTANFPAGLSFEYSVNGSAKNAVVPMAPFDEVLAQGTNTVDYFFTDCAGNESTCSFDITIEDNEPPVISCPPNQTVNLDLGDCDKDVIIPLFTNVTDNCGVTTPSIQTQPADSLSSLITFSYNPNLGDYVADDKTFTFSGLQGDATPGGVKLIIEIQADVDSVGEYFQIYANSIFLGTTANNQSYVSAGNCSTPSTATFTIPAVTFNDWTAAGDIIVEAVSFMSYPIPPAGPTWGINPCDAGQVTADGDTDGSYIRATFSYESVIPTFAATGANSIDPIALTPPLEADTINLSQGTTTFSYSVTDLAGNVGTCEFEVNVVDVEPPVALCGPAFVDINPSGFDVDTVFANEIDLGSTDNCSIISMTVSPNVFSCENQGTEPVVLTVTDASGNVSTCNTFVNVTTQKPNPTAQSDCGNTFLQLFANPPASSAGNNVIYNYTWFNPQGVPFSFVQNPIIQDANISHVGFYTVVIEGVTFCESMSSVQVTCDALPLQKPVLQVADNKICANEVVEMSTAQVCGSSVKYNWYTGPFPGVFMGSTTQPSYSMAPPSSGNFTFYVIVERNGCISEVSAEVAVQVNAAPTATAGQSNIFICAGEEVLLNSLNVPQGATCHWTGPCGFEAFVCNPAPITNISSCNSGEYHLVVTSNNGCASEPDTVFVNVINLPQMPFISNNTSANNPACHGEAITLTATPVFGAVAYEWTTPVFTTITTPVNVLTIQNSDISKDAGQWRVKVIGNPCESLNSQPTTVHIEPLPEAVSSAITPSEACEGQNVQLSASSATPNVTYKWTYPNGQTSAQANPILTNVSDANDGTYSLTITTQFGCKSQGTLDLEILDRVDITGISSNAPPCASGPVNVQLMATLFPMDGGNYQYLWTGPGGFQSTNPMATISGGTADDSGPYILLVTNAEGCTSLPATVDVEIPEVLATPASPVLSVANPHCVGNEITLTTTPYNGSNATYYWITPNNTYTTSSPSLVLNDVELDDAGSYYVHYQVDGCLSSVSGGMNVQVNPIPLISPSSNSPVCEGDIIELDIDCTAGASYEWFGPGSFGSAACNPVIVNANPNLHTGTYSVRKKVDGCWSEVSTFNIEVKDKPNMPSALNAGPYCADTEDVILSVTANSGTPGAVYTWYDENNVPLNNGTPALNFSVPNASALGDDMFQYYVIATLDGCESTPSFTTNVVINTIPANIAEAGPAIEACQGDDIFLQGTMPSVGTGWWTSAPSNPPGVTIFNPNLPNTEIEGMIPIETYTFQWTLSNGACEDYSNDVTTVYVNQVEQADAGDAFTVCHTNTATLTANMPVSNVGQWSQPPAQEMLGVFINTPNSPTTVVSGLVPGNNYIFTWTIDGGCGATSNAVILTVTNENAFAGMDYEDCGDGSTQLDAVAPLSENGMWTSPDPNIVFSTPTDPQTVAEGLQEGLNILVWTIDDGDCGHFSTDSIMIDYQYAPVAVSDEASVGFAEDVTVNVISNDDIPPVVYTLNILQAPLYGTASLKSNGNLTYQADVNFIGTDTVYYEICSELCECVATYVALHVGEDAGCMAPSIITPNDDGMNDAFVVPCLAELDNDGFSNYPNNVVSIFNQWGDEVYHAEPYQNDWFGTFNGEELPAGTYFYIIDLGKGDKPMSGYLILQR